MPNSKAICDEPVVMCVCVSVCVCVCVCVSRIYNGRSVHLFLESRWTPLSCVLCHNEPTGNCESATRRFHIISRATATTMNKPDNDVRTVMVLVLSTMSLMSMTYRCDTILYDEISHIVLMLIALYNKIVIGMAKTTSSF